MSISVQLRTSMTFKEHLVAFSLTFFAYASRILHFPMPGANIQTRWIVRKSDFALQIDTEGIWWWITEKVSRKITYTEDNLDWMDLKDFSSSKL